eukprot:IDg5802t1
MSFSSISLCFLDSRGAEFMRLQPLRDIFNAANYNCQGYLIGAYPLEYDPGSATRGHNEIDRTQNTNTTESKRNSFCSRKLIASAFILLGATTAAAGQPLQVMFQPTPHDVRDITPLRLAN